MKKSVDRLKRIVSLQNRAHDLAAKRLDALERESASLEAELARSVAALGDGDLAFGPAAAMVARRVRRLDGKIEIVEKERAAQAARTLAEGARAKLADRRHAAADDRHREQRARKELADVIERWLAAGKASPEQG